MTVGGYSILGIVLLNVSAWLTDLAVLRRFSDTAQLVHEKNLGVGAVHFGIYLATGLIAAALCQVKAAVSFLLSPFFSWGRFRSCSSA